MAHWGSLLPFGIFFGLALLTQLAEKVWPLRIYSKPKAWAIDSFGLALAAGVTVAFRVLQNNTIDRLPTVSGFGWLADVSHLTSHVPWPVAFVISVVVLDFLLYVGHRLLHTSLLWHTHAAHHSVERLYWLGGNRSSPFHTAFQLTWGGFLGLVWPMSGGGLARFVAGSILYTCIQHFNHANLRWRLGPLEWLFVVPRYHFVHHGADPKLNNSNFGFLFTVWDRMLGTYTNPDSVPKDFPLGLDYEVGFTRLFLGLPPARALPTTPEFVPPATRTR